MPLLTNPLKTVFGPAIVCSRIELSRRVGVTSAGRGVIGRWLMSYACAAQPPRHVLLPFSILVTCIISSLRLTSLFSFTFVVDELWDLCRTWEVPA